MFDAFNGLIRMALPGRDKVHTLRAQGRVELSDPTAPIRMPLHWSPAPEPSPTTADDKPQTTP